jgi:hypothetical protein
MRHAPPRTNRMARLCVALVLCLAPIPATASPIQFLPVGDPIERELRLLDLLPPDSAGTAIRLPHLHSRPLRHEELRGGDEGPAAGELAAISRERLTRWLARDFPGPAGAPPGTTPRLVQIEPDERSRLEISAALEGRAEVDEHDFDVLSESGFHLRSGVQLGRFFAYSDLLFGQVDSARAVTDPLVANTDLALTTSDSYLAWSDERGDLGLQAGLTRLHWGPGAEAGLLISRTAAAMGGLRAHAGLRTIGLDFEIFNATLASAEGRQLAAHRLEWQPVSSLRLGLAETAVYHAPGWNALYAVGVIPYSVVQRIQNQSEPDSATALRNNVTAAFDVAWRFVEGNRAYAEVVLDDVHVKTAEVPNKWGYLLGWDGVGKVGRSRVRWNGEYTRISRYVYTSFYGATLEVRGRPIGYPTGPDARRIRARVACDWGAGWQLFAASSRTDQGEGDLATPYVPGTPYGDPLQFEGIVERTRDVELGLRWWPASGTDLSVSGGWREIENRDHVSGESSDRPFAALEIRIVR